MAKTNKKIMTEDEMRKVIIEMNILLGGNFKGENEEIRDIREKVKEKYGIQDDTILKQITTKDNFEKIELVRESRVVLNTNARNVGRERQQPSLFDPTTDFISNRNLDREKYSKDTGVLIGYLISEWDKHRDNNDELYIKNIGHIAKKFNTTQLRIKQLMVLASGFIRPVILTQKNLDNGKMEITEGYRQILTIDFIYEINKNIKEEEIEYIGTKLSKYPKDISIKGVKIKPDNAIIKSLQKDNFRNMGLGFVFATPEGLLLGLGLSDMAYKIYEYTGAQHPKGKIGLVKLFTKLNITEKDIKDSGKPRIIKRVEKASNELQNKGHFIQWSISKNEIFSWEYSDKYFKHSDFYKKEKTIKKKK